MKRFKVLFRSVIFPPAWVVVLCSLAGFPAMIISLIFLDSTNPLSCLSYVLSAYALTVLCTSLPRAIRRLKELICGDELKAVASFKRFMHRYKYTSMYLDDKQFRARVSLYIGLAVNLFYALFKCCTGAVFRSAWLWAIGIYYVVLSAIRFSLLRNVRITDKKEYSIDKKIHEYKSARVCGIMMFALNIAMTAMAVQMVLQNRGYEYKGHIIYISALYAFYSLVHAIVNIVKFSKINNPILTAAKITSLAGALMSMFALQTAMFSSFGTTGANYQRIMNTATGSVVCASVLGMAVFLILWSNKNLKALENDS